VVCVAVCTGRGAGLTAPGADGDTFVGNGERGGGVAETTGGGPKLSRERRWDKDASRRVE
jgi:hypothetical protein